MANTGFRGFMTLIQVNVLTGQPTGLTKPNLPSDADYIPPQYAPDFCPLPFGSECIVDNPVFFEPADTTVVITWDTLHREAFGTSPMFQVWLYNSGSGLYDFHPLAVLSADVPPPDTTEFVYDNSAGDKGYIVMSPISCSVEPPPPSGVAPTIVLGQLLPDAVIGVPYFASVYFDGSVPATVASSSGEAWMLFSPVDNTIQITGTPTGGAVSGAAISFVVDNTFGTDSFTDTIDVLVIPPVARPEYGVIILQGTTTIDQRLTVAQNMGVGLWRGSHATISDYHGEGNGTFNKLQTRGMKYLLNVNWNRGGSPTGMFATNETTYKSQLQWIIDDYANDLSVMRGLVSENEPTNRHYYGDTMANYIRQLEWFIDVCVLNGIPCADGCLHIDPILGVKRGNTGGVYTLVDQVLTGIANLTSAGKILTWCNMHTPITATFPASGDVAEAAQYVRDRTGINDIIMNEFSFRVTDPLRAQDMIAQTKDADLKIAIPFGGECPPDAGQSVPFNCGLVLTTLGEVIRDAIPL